MSRFLHQLRRDCTGGPTAEFALVLPLLILFLLGTIDVGRFLWTWNEAEKATQMGVRFAVVTSSVPTGIASFDFVGTNGLTQGEPVGSNSFGGIQCKSAGGAASCACKDSAKCPSTLVGAASTAAFTNVVNRMKAFKPNITADNVVIDYDWSGLGYAGDPNGSDIAPMVTVKLQGMQFLPTTFLLLTAINLPDFRSSLSMEDGDGDRSN